MHLMPGTRRNGQIHQETTRNIRLHDPQPGIIRLQGGNAPPQSRQRLRGIGPFGRQHIERLDISRRLVLHDLDRGPAAAHHGRKGILAVRRTPIPDHLHADVHPFYAEEYPAVGHHLEHPVAEVLLQIGRERFDTRR